MNLSSRIKITKVKDHSTAATDAIESSYVDMAGYEGVLFMTSVGTANAGNYINAKQCDTSDGTYADLEGTKVTSGTSDEDLWVDVYRPQERYVKCYVTRGASTTCESIWAIQYGARKAPVDNTTSGTIAGELHASPAEGTA